MDVRKITSGKGAVTFLDVLGWKGIWERNQFAINKLQSFVYEMQKKAQEVSEKYMDDPSLRGKSNPTEVLSISDTIAIFTSASPQAAIGIHAELCSWALSYSLEQELPLRGAISYGEYSIADNIMLGYAVDEYNNIPFKRSMKTLNLCVKWSFGDEKVLYDIIQKKGPHIPEIAPKYLNTLEFLQR